MVLSDRIQTTTFDNAVAGYEYYPFGMALQTFESEQYRYGFNGQEKDDDWNGNGNSYDFGARIYDSRLGRFLGIDPDREDYPYLSPFNYAANMPIKLIDMNGKGPRDPLTHRVSKGETLYSLSKQYGVSVKDLAALNNIVNPDLIYAGETLKVNPEMDFMDNPYGGYQNPSDERGEIVKIPYLVNVGVGFAVGAGAENLVIEGGGALTSIQQWDKVQDLMWEGYSTLMEDGKLTPGEVFTKPWSPGSLVNYMEKVVKGKEDLVSPVHVIGSFSFSMRVNADGQTYTISVFDSKTISSLSDNKLGDESNSEREWGLDENQPFTTTYQRYIWDSDLSELEGFSDKWEEPKINTTEPGDNTRVGEGSGF